jgi:hypothetical protein
MKLHFDRTGVERLLAHTREAPAHTPINNDPASAAPGLNLVGDDGIYLLSNGNPPLLVEAGKPRNVVCHATEANAETLPFQQWWDVKNAAFGGDDGGEFLSAAAIVAALKTYHPGEPLTLDVTPGSIGMVYYRPKPKASTPATGQKKPA